MQLLVVVQQLQFHIHAHGLSVGNFVTFTGSSAVGGITPNATEMEVVTVPDANTYTVTFTSAATSGATGGGSSGNS